MSGLAALGGLGAGLMAGSNFIQNKNMQDARLGMLQEQQSWQREDRQAQQAELKRKAQFDQIYADEWNTQGPDADPLQVATNIFKRSVATGQARRDELEPLLAGVKEMRQRGITTAIRMGNGPALEGAFSQQFGQPVQVQTRMTKDQFGHQVPVFLIVGQDGKVLQQLDALQVGSILGADDILADEERKMNQAKGLADIDSKRASAESSRASAANSYASAEGRRQTNAQERALWEAQQAVAAGTATPQQQALLQQQATGKDKEGFLTAGAKELEMFQSMPPEQQQRYRARVLEDVRNELRKSNDTQFLGSAGAQRLEAEAQRQTDARLGASQSGGGTAKPPAGQFTPGKTYTDANGNKARYNADGTWTEL